MEKKLRKVKVSDYNIISTQIRSSTQYKGVGPVVSYTGPMSSITDEELDQTIRHLRLMYPRAGISTLSGMLLTLGLRVSRERIRLSLTRVDPVQRLFQRITIERRVYTVPGPMALWHHDGQHGES